MSKEKITYLEDNEFTTPNVSAEKTKKPKNIGVLIIIFLILALVMGSAGAIGTMILVSGNSKLSEKLGLKNVALNTTKTEKLILEESSLITSTVDKVSPSVVSISTSKNITDLFGRTYEQTGGGTGFIITNDGLIATNKHVVSDANAEYTVFTSDGKSYPAKIMATDSLNDLAVIKIEASGLPVVDLGDSDKLDVGQWVVAIGNALGEFNNTVTVGVISAKDRKITASGGGTSESLEGLLQTDAAINSGNSGGPLVNLKGQVIGINTAVAGSAQNIGFAIPINSVKKAIDSIKKTGKIERPMLGVRYLPINKELAKANQLAVDYGAWVLPGSARGEVAVIPGSPADKAGIVENDIITKIDGTQINENNSLSKTLQSYNVGDEVEITFLHKGDEKTAKVKLTEAQ
ncbi:MAG: trypsin-like peptidase domain-containing protein [Patescibacteria group bacterium]|nr:trypsin-like peptidase domain-containing protein [Patescibacteria group bacterium]